MDEPGAGRFMESTLPGHPRHPGHPDVGGKPSDVPVVSGVPVVPGTLKLVRVRSGGCRRLLELAGLLDECLPLVAGRLLPGGLRLRARANLDLGTAIPRQGKAGIRNYESFWGSSMGSEPWTVKHDTHPLYSGLPQYCRLLSAAEVWYHLRVFGQMAGDDIVRELIGSVKPRKRADIPFHPRTKTM